MLLYFLPLKDGAYSVSLASPVRAFLLTSWKFQSFSPEVAIVPPSSATYWGSTGYAGKLWGWGGWRAAVSSPPAHPQLLQCWAFPVSRCTGCMGPRNHREAVDALLAMLQQETGRENLQSLRLLSEMKHMGISQCQSLLGWISPWQKQGGKACLNSHINHSLPHSRRHVRITFLQFSNLNEFKIKLVQDPLPPPQLYVPLFLLYV